MIEQTTVSGRPATVAYLTVEGKPATREQHDLVKVIFEDGDIAFLAPPIAKYDPDQPRAPKGSEEGGQWIDDPNKPRVIRSGDKELTSLEKKLRAVIDELPPEHMKLVKGTDIYAVYDLTPGHAENTGTTGQFRQIGWPLGSIDIAKNIRYRSGTYGSYSSGLRNQESTLVHELGHALDYAVRWDHDPSMGIPPSRSLSIALTSSIRSAAEKLTPKEKWNGYYYLNSRSEGFAELYSLAYTPRWSKAKYFGGIKRDRAEQVFAAPIAEMKELLSKVKSPWAS